MIAAWAVGITAAYTILTFLLFREATSQSNAARDVSQSAKETLEETKKEFNIVNDPYIEVEPDSSEILSFVVGDPMQSRYLLINLKDVPAKVISSQTIMRVSINPPDFDSLKIMAKDLIEERRPNVNRFITKETPVYVNGTASVLVSQIQVDSLNGRYHLYIFSGVKFQNVITGDYKYNFMLLQHTFRGPRLITEIIQNTMENAN